MVKRLSLVTVLVSASAFAFSGITYLSNTPITRFDAQYGQDSARITINLPVQNPDNCSLADGTYETDPSLAGSKLSAGNFAHSISRWQAGRAGNQWLRAKRPSKNH